MSFLVGMFNFIFFIMGFVGMLLFSVVVDDICLIFVFKYFLMLLFMVGVFVVFVIGLLYYELILFWNVMKIM